ncbi:PREDICTED: adhesion G-protein coupled receptor D1-like [Priapulus caudatus]|uniref:Adhesion G-protein coupled receptor D1-like n=1 Tax=Priapulus caudatus TaxID=37621 RepID=A0ABM1F237_PRICU|nr:PREDICTED: adhesion G-protein coupled receptor D1-like [Priapulus caudatus]
MAPPTPSTDTPIIRVVKTTAQVVTKGGSSFFMSMLIMSLLAFLAIWNFSPHRIIHMNMEISLLMAHLLLFIGDPAQPELCKAVSILLHYFFTASFAFMFLEGLHIYSLMAQIVPRNGILNRAENTLLGWCDCWLDVSSPLVVTAFVPNGIMIVCALILLESSGTANFRQLDDVDRPQLLSAQINQKANMVILPMMSISWVLGVMGYDYQDLSLFSLFGVFCSITGWMMFSSHSLGNEKVRAIFQQLWFKVISCFCPRKARNMNKIYEDEFDMNDDVWAVAPGSKMKHLW